MIVPGSNLLGLALRVIGQQTVAYFKDMGRDTTLDGEYITQLAAPVNVSGCSVQAVDRMKYGEAGLDQAKAYYIWYTQQDVQGVARGKSGDVVEFQGRRYQVCSDTPWYGLDGWDGCLMIDIGPASGALQTPPLQVVFG